MRASRYAPVALLGATALVFVAGGANCDPTGAELPNPPLNALPAGESFGRFEGRVIAEWTGDGRNMRLIEDFAYIDGTGRIWRAPAGSIINGASIPQAFWSFIGGPFEGPYRNASVIHDVACEDQSASWEDVHRAFYDACRCGGVSDSKAKLMYWAVYRFGPRWEATPSAAVAAAPPEGSGVWLPGAYAALPPDRRPPPDAVPEPGFAEPAYAASGGETFPSAAPEVVIPEPEPSFAEIAEALEFFEEHEVAVEDVPEL